MTVRDTFFRRGESEVEIEGCTVTVDLSQTGSDLEPGDLYVAERNTSPELLTCAKVHMKEDSPVWCVFPEELAYAYDCNECRKVVAIDGEAV